MEKTNIAYVAGLFDGEGSISIGRGRVKRGSTKLYLKYTVQVSITQSRDKGKQILEDLQKKFGGTASEITKYFENRKDRKTSFQHYRWRLGNQTAYKFLCQIYLYSKIKKEQIILAAEFQEILNSYSKKTSPSEIERIEKFSYYETAKREMSFLNGQKVKKISWMK